MTDSNKYRNDFIKEKYDRIYVTVPKGKKVILKRAADDLDMSLNAYVNLCTDFLEYVVAYYKEKNNG